MVKEELVANVSKDTGYSQIVVSKIIESVLANITSELSIGNRIQLMGFGVFEPKRMAARTGRNPHTNEPVPIPARVVPSFKPGNRLKEAVTRTEC